MLRNQSCDYPFFICMPTLTQGMLLWHMCLWMSFKKKKILFKNMCLWMSRVMTPKQF